MKFVVCRIESARRSESSTTKSRTKTTKCEYNKSSMAFFLLVKLVKAADAINRRKILKNNMNKRSASVATERTNERYLS